MSLTGTVGSVPEWFFLLFSRKTAEERAKNFFADVTTESGGCHAKNVPSDLTEGL